jgi:hypothetical protein
MSREFAVLLLLSWALHLLHTVIPNFWIRLVLLGLQYLVVLALVLFYGFERGRQTAQREMQPPTAGGRPPGTIFVFSTNLTHASPQHPTACPAPETRRPGARPRG